MVKEGVTTALYATFRPTKLKAMRLACTPDKIWCPCYRIGCSAFNGTLLSLPQNKLTFAKDVNSMSKLSIDLRLVDLVLKKKVRLMKFCNMVVVRRLALSHCKKFMRGGVLFKNPILLQKHLVAVVKFERGKETPTSSTEVRKKANCMPVSSKPYRHIDAINVKFGRVYDFKDISNAPIVETEVVEGSGLKFVPNTTILYVDDPAMFVKPAKAVVIFQDRSILAPVKTTKDRVFCNSIRLQINPVPSDSKQDNEIPCSEFGLELECKNQKCYWVQANRKARQNYSTCTKHPETCPDGTCDGLEHLSNSCPQDCTSKKGKCVCVFIWPRGLSSPSFHRWIFWVALWRSTLGGWDSPSFSKGLSLYLPGQFLFLHPSVWSSFSVGGIRIGRRFLSKLLIVSDIYHLCNFLNP